MEINILFIKQKGDKMRLINGDALMKAMYHRAFETDGDTMWQSGCWVRYRAIEQVVKDQPTIEERKSGKWEIYVISPFDGEGCRCSECNYEGAPYWDFCPNCGADMRG